MRLMQTKNNNFGDMKRSKGEQNEKEKKNVAACVSDKKGMLSFQHESVCSLDVHI